MTCARDAHCITRDGVRDCYCDDGRIYQNGSCEGITRRNECHKILMSVRIIMEHATNVRTKGGTKLGI